MAKPNHTTGATQIYSRLSGDLVSTYASAVYRAVIPAEALPGPTDKPVIVFDMDADYANSTDDSLVVDLDIAVYVIRHAQASVADADTAVGRIVGDGSTYGLYDWAPTISGIGASRIDLLSSGEGQYDTDHAASILRFNLVNSEA